MILVPHDGHSMSDKALKYAINIAKNLNMKIKLVRVVEDIPDFSFMSHRGPTGRAQVKRDIEFLKKHTRDKEYKRLERHLSLIKSEGIEASSLVVEGGEPGKEIISIIEKEKPYLVVIGSRKMKSKGLSKIKVLGSVARKLAEGSKCPVLIVR